VSILSVVLAFMLPKTYRSASIIMPPTTSSERGVFGSGSGMLAIESLLSPTSSSDANTFLAILKSHTIMQSVIEKFNLVEFYDVENNEKAQESLEDDTNFEIDEEGTIRVETYIKTDWFHSDEDEEICKTLSRDITNYFVVKLDIVNKRLKSEKAMQHRIFIENRYNQNIIDLAIAEEKLKTYQEINKTVAIPKESNASIQVSAEILSRITIQKVRLGMLEKTLTESHPEVQILKSEISELEKELSDVPNLILELGRLIRDVEVQNILYTFLTQQYEEAKIQEAKDTPTVQVLDYAVLPQLKYKPVRSRIVIIGFVLSTIFSLYYVYFRARWQLLSNTIK